MKQITTLFCCVCLMIAGISLAVWKDSTKHHQQIVAAQPLQWAPNKSNVLPLDLQLSLNNGQHRETSVKDSVNIVDSVRWVTKTRWKTRYKDLANRTEAREAGKHLAAVTPDSMPKNPAKVCTLEDREEQPSEAVDTSKVSSIQLIVDGNVVYSKDDNHSAEEGKP